MKIIKSLKNFIKRNNLRESINEFFVKIQKVVYKSVFTFNLHAGTENAGYLAFSIIFAIFPFMIFFTIIISYIGQTGLGIKLLEVIEHVLPQDISKTLLPVIDSVIQEPKGSILSIATLTLIWSASSLVQGLKGVLDRAFRIKTKKSYFFDRTISIAKFLLITIFIIMSILATIIFPKILIFIGQFVPIKCNADHILIFLKPVLLNIFLFIFIISIYYIIPSKQNKLKDVFWGTILTITGWNISLKILTFYLLKISKFQVVYGSLTGIIISLFFFYIMAIILIFGAEFNYNVKEIFYKKRK